MGHFRRIAACAALLGATCATAGDNVGGGWSAVGNWPLIALHSVLTPDGRLLTYGTDGNGIQTGLFIYDVWDPAAGLGGGHVTLPNTTNTDLFCSAQLILPNNGKIFLAGGDVYVNGATTNTGTNDTNLFSPTDNSLTRTNDMQRARWYATTTTLLNGTTFIMGGTSGEDRPELRDANGVFTLFNGIDTSALRPLYPRNYLAPDGRIFGYDTYGQMYYITTSGNGSFALAAHLPGTTSWTSTSVMYAPGKILQIGGASATSYIIDINGSQPVVTTTQAMATQRQWVTGTVLPNGRVLATGGSTVANQLSGVNNTAAIWNPATGTWTIGPSGAIARLYHSTATLLPDASVLVAGGGAPGPLTNLNAEIYYPPYLYNSSGGFAARPSITSAPDALDIGASFNVAVPSPASISRVTLVKTPSVTHSFNMEQRFVELTFSVVGGQLSVQAPAAATTAPPGYYYLFVINSSGVPSVAKIVRMNIAGSGPPPDTTAPSVPQNLQVTGTVSNTISLAWSASTDTGGSGLSGYRIYRNGGATPIASVSTPSFNDTGLSPGTTYTYRVSAFDGAGNESAKSNQVSGTTTAAPIVLTGVDIGPVQIAGGETQNGSNFTVTASGKDIWRAADEFHFTYQTLSGDGEIRAQVASIVNTAGWAKAGVMIRESLAANSRYAFSFMTPSNGAHLHYRTTTGANAGPSTNIVDTSVTPKWVRLVRAGNAFTAYKSDDGVAWTSLGSITIAMNSNTLIGLAFTSGNAAALSTAVFNNVSISGGTPPPDTTAPSVPQNPQVTGTTSSSISLGWSASTDTGGSGLAGYRIYRNGGATPITSITGTTFTDTGLASSTSYTYRISAFDLATNESAQSTQVSGTTAAAGATWSGLDIGPVQFAGGESQNGNNFTVTASGKDIWKAADEFHYTYQTLNGDGEIRAQVASIVNTAGWAKAGVMIRESLAANSRYAFSLMTPSNGAHLHYRTATGANAGPATNVVDTSVTPEWVRLVRAGNVFTAYRSDDGVTWTSLGSITIAMNSSTFIGLAFTSGNAAASSTAVFNNVAISTAPPTDTTPPSVPQNPQVTSTTTTSVSLTWNASMDTGGSGVAGYRVYRNGGATPVASVTGTTFTDTGLTPNTSYTYQITAYDAAVPANESGLSTQVSATTAALASWTGVDIGPVQIPGGETQNGADVTVQASGKDIWKASDEFHYTYQTLSGNGEMRARVASFVNTAGWAKAGIMIRESLAANSRYAFSMISPSNGAHLHYRATTGANAGPSTNVVDTAAVPEWVRLVRAGNVFTAYKSDDGVTWTSLGSITIAMNANTFVGLAVTSGAPTLSTTVGFENVATQ